MAPSEECGLRNGVSHQMPADETGQTNRRQHDRQISVMRVARLSREGQEHLCVIRNISSGGAMAQVYFSCAAGDAIALECGGSGPVKGRVAWVSGGHVGIAFLSPVSVDHVLAKDAHSAGDGGRKVSVRPLRLAVCGGITLLHKGVEYCGKICDISQRGAKMALDNHQSLTIDHPVSLYFHANPGQVLAGQVRWQRKASVGIQFETALALQQIAEISHILLAEPKSD